MELKEYQQRALARVEAYLAQLDRWKAKNEQVIKAAGPESALNVPEKAWNDTTKAGSYLSRRNGLKEQVPNFCLKIPTGGGKTLLAVKTIDLIQSHYLKRKTGFVLWIVPTTQIYRQTLASLGDRAHPYRQHLDIASGGRTLIREKTDLFTPADVREDLVVMLLMLPAANRQSKETLRLFRDSGGFGAFFPPEEEHGKHAEVLKRFPNLDAFGEEKGFFGRQIKTSLGNTLRTLHPVIILDEGHKAYSETAQDTLFGFNPCLIVELSATPKPESNVLVDIPGLDLAREQMIKLDLHLINKASTDWKVTLLAAKEKRDVLEEKARELEANGGAYIRPICLIQVERTGKDQRSAKFIHAEDAREYLVQTCGVDPAEVAVKSSEKDDIEGMDLFSRECRVRYIITKQALQEGWDCSFAYVLAILTNPSSKDSLTQLVGRILRQPYAKKTGKLDLDESYVFCFQKAGSKLLESVRQGFRQEGLGDLEGRVVGGDPGDETEAGERTVEIRRKFRKFAGKIYLPVFAFKDDGKWRQVSYEMDILSRVNWDDADFEPVRKMELSLIQESDLETAIGLSRDEKEVIEKHAIERLKEGQLELDYVFVARHLADIIPNPWVAHEIGESVFEALLAKYERKLVQHNLVHIIGEIRRRAEKEKNRLAEEVFRGLLKEKKLRFVMIREDFGFRLPSQRTVPKSAQTLTKKSGEQLEKSLFDFIPEDDLNETEKAVAWYMEEQERLLWWYRNISRQDYAIQGWQRNKVYADFVTTRVDAEDKTEYDRVFVVESKGLHLAGDAETRKGNPDTVYKEALFKLCNESFQEKSWLDLGKDFTQKKVVFQVVYSDEWQARMDALLAQV